MSVLTAVSGGAKSGQVLEEGAALAAAFDETLVVLHVMSEAEFDDHSDAQRGYSVSKGENNAIETAKAVASQVDDDSIDVETVGRVGDVATQITTEAEQRDSRYVVVGGRKRSPTGKAVFGSVPQSVILGAPCPVVTVLRD